MKPLTRLLIGLALIAMPASFATPATGAVKERKCGSFKARDGARIKVSAAVITCSKAMAIQRELWLGKKKDQRSLGDFQMYGVKLKKYPGYICRGNLELNWGACMASDGRKALYKRTPKKKG